MTEEEIEKLKKDWQELELLYWQTFKSDHLDIVEHQQLLIDLSQRKKKEFRWAVLEFTGGNWSDSKLKAKGWLLPAEYRKPVDTETVLALHLKHNLPPHPTLRSRIKGRDGADTRALNQKHLEKHKGLLQSLGLSKANTENQLKAISDHEYNEQRAAMHAAKFEGAKP